MILVILFVVFMVLALPAAWPGVAWPFGYTFLWLAVLVLALIAHAVPRI